MPGTRYVDTPKTTADISHITDGLNGLDKLSPEKSFVSPGARGRDLFKPKPARNGPGDGIGGILKTPRVGDGRDGRNPLKLLPNGVAHHLPPPKAAAEFTPLLKSVTRKNHAQRASGRKGGGQSAGFTKDDSELNGRASAGLPRVSDGSAIYSEKTSSSAGDAENATPLAQLGDNSSGFESTPLARLPGRNEAGPVVGDGNVMTLREQENIIDRIEKENWGLKLKIYHLEQIMNRKGPELNTTAIKENTDLKVDRITMQRELHKLKKSITEAERDAHLYRVQLDEYRERVRRDQSDETVRVEMERLTNEVKTKDGEVEDLRNQVRELEEEIEVLQESLEEEKQKAGKDNREAIEDLEAQLEELREEKDSLNDELLNKEHPDDALLEKMEQLEEDMGKKSLEVDQLREQVQQLENEVEVLHTSLDEEKDKVGKDEKELRDGYEGELQQVRQERDHLQSELGEKQRAIERDSGSIEELRAEVDSKGTEIDHLQEQVQQLEEEVEVLQAGAEEDKESQEREKREALERVEAQLRDLKQERQTLQDQVGSMSIELHEAKNSVQELRADKEELEDRLLEVKKPTSNTFEIDHEKRELQRARQGLQNEVDRLRTERDSLEQNNVALKKDLEDEVDRASTEEHQLKTELDRLRTRQISASDHRDRELTSAQNTISRLERRNRELEELVEKQLNEAPLADTDEIPALREEIGDLRRKEAASVNREMALKSTSRELKSKVTKLEREVHELQMSKMSGSKYSSTPVSSPPGSAAKELFQTREDLLAAHAALEQVRQRNRDLEEKASKEWVNESERADLHELVKSSTLEAEALSLKLSNRDTRLSELRAQVKRLRADRERAQARAQALNQQLNTLQEGRRSHFDDDGLALQDAGEEASIQQKELRGLMKEVVWLRARCRREESFRRDLAWSKGFMEMGEGIRAACNQADLRMIEDMGVEAPLKTTYETRLASRQKLRASIFAVIAANRMSRLEKEWRDLKTMGEDLRRRREGQKRRTMSSR